ncbi:hypothetical protein [Planococcus versutus]|uniref:Uncharacterized protein n=1 Tax=Planococcus versutus TaxID=1302659 RepID=A0A1B1S094_9BACL|nr:hypothetical protein [Planococcus versutus]ANU26584.1 hypothetical protein I858_006045 [Planococcus versutus]
MVEDKKKQEQVEQPKIVDTDEVEKGESVETESKFDKIYSNVASNRYENLRTSYIEIKAKELRKRKK